MADYDDPGTSSSSLKGKEWYHGKVTRIHSESVLKEEGEFLVRDSISSPGSYVLTVRYKRKALHFQINSTTEKGRKMYHFEEEFFSSVVDLITFYLAHKKAITLSSGCTIEVAAKKSDSASSNPNFYGKELEASYMHIFRPGQPLATQRSLSQQVLLNQTTKHNGQQRLQRPLSTISHNLTRVPPPPSSLINRPLPVPIRSPRNSQEDGEDYCDMDYDAMEDLLDASSTSFSPRFRSGSIQSLPTAPLSRQFQSVQNLRVSSPTPAKPSSTKVSRPPLPPRPANLSERVPPLPSTVGTVLRSPKEEARDSAFVDYDDIRTKRPEDDYDSVTAINNRLSAGSDYDVLGERSRTPTQRDSGIYSSPSPPNESESSFSQVQLNQLRLFVLNKKPVDICEAISYDDARMLKFLGLSEKSGLGFDNGLRIILLPHGNSLRNQLINRCRCLQLAVVLSMTSSNKQESARMIRQWILSAAALLKAGNVFAFANIMNAIEHKSIQSIPWLRSALDLQSKSELESLRVVYRNLKSGAQPELAGTVIPFIQPVLEIFSGSSTQYLDESSYANEIDSLWRWLENARKWSENVDGMRDVARGRYIRKSRETPLGESQIQRLVLGPHSNMSEVRFSMVSDAVEKLIQEIC